MCAASIERLRLFVDDTALVYKVCSTEKTIR